MYHYHKIIALLIFTMWLVLYMRYYLSKNTLVVQHIDNIKKLQNPANNITTVTEDFLINTPGCFIPNYTKNLIFQEPSYNSNNTCGQRVVFIKRIASDKLLFEIDKAIMNKYSRKMKYECCYRFASRSTTPGSEDNEIYYTICKSFQNGSKVKHRQEVITVTCVIRPPKSKSVIIYEDAYIIIKKIKTEKRKPNTKSWNVLLLGMDTMSRARVFSTMPYLVQYLQQNNWLDYKGYQKMGFDTFPNFISLLTGKNTDTVYKNCNSSMHKCNKYFIWSMFKDVGYVTAYGKDNLKLPDTFFPNQGFKSPPTDHYMQPLFLTGEKRYGHLVCTKKMPSAQHLLDYAYQFVDAYKNKRFFGTFWLKSYSHRLENLPSLFDVNIVRFFETLQHSGALNNTFVMFISDHGIRYGDTRIPMSSYYEERLPMFFIWVPLEFKKLYYEEYFHLKMNQNRLTTPYDIYVTLAKILQIPNKVIRSEACPQCKSLFEEVTPHRTCADANINEKWCSCHNMSSVDENDVDAKYSAQLVVSQIQNRSESIKTINCMACHRLYLESILRTHSYTDGINNTYYVIAVQMYPGNLTFEATIFNDGKQFTILEPTETISPYNLRGNCVINPSDRKYCVCKFDTCNKNW